MTDRISHSLNKSFIFIAVAIAFALCAGALSSTAAFAETPEDINQSSSEQVITPQESEPQAQVIATAETTGTEQSSGTAVPASKIPTPTKAGWTKAADGTWYYFKSVDAKPVTGWIKDGGSWYYLDPAKDGAMATGKYKVDGAWYISRSSGVMRSSAWVKLGNDWYYASSSGALKMGWLKDGGSWYYLDPAKDGVMLTGKYKVGNAWYISRSSGVMRSSAWVKLGNDWYYATGSGALKSGWIKDAGKWYFLKSSQDGRMATNEWITDGGSDYYLTSSGVMKTGWLQDGSNWYYLVSSGAKKFGWQKDGSKWYYLDRANNGIMVTSTMKTINNSLYSFASSGAMEASKEFSLDNNTKYGFAYPSGEIVPIGTIEDGKVFLKTSSGKILTGWQKLAGHWFYGDDKTGQMVRGDWKKTNGKWYYLDRNGAMATGTRTIDGVTYFFDSSGAWAQITNDANLDSRIMSKAKSLGSLRACYDWVKGHVHTNWASGTGVLRYANGTHATTTSWVGTEAKRMLDGNTTDCYAFSSAFACLAKALGYDAKVVNGYVPSRSVGWASHSWVEINQGGTTYVYDPDLGRSLPAYNFYGFTYGSAPTNYKK